MSDKSSLPRKTAPPDGTYGEPGGVVGPVKLVVVQGPDEGREVPLEGLTLVGSDPECTLPLVDPAVSFHHGSFMRLGPTILVRDQGSRNGIFLGGVRVTEAEVPLGAMVQVGNSVLVVYPRWHVREVLPSTARRFGDLIGESLGMREQFAIMERIAPTDLTVLIEGESGTGKELAARSIHRAGTRSKGPYVVFDCGSVPHELAESELFGHKKGSFSGAIGDRAGLFARANGGTLCLDEIGELPLPLQPKLLRVLETGEVRPVGQDNPVRVDVRVLAATNRVLRAEVARGSFRADLLYRLEVVRITLPPLRQRPEDIPALVRHILASHLPDGDGLGGDNLKKLLAYSWPGNVRELRNTLLRAAALAGASPDHRVPFASLVFNFGPGSEPKASTPIGSPFQPALMALPYKEAKAQLLGVFDREYLEALFARHGRNLTQAAQAAGLSRKHLYELMRRTGDEDPPVEADPSQEDR